MALLIYASSNGDQWLLTRDAEGRAVIRHEPNPRSGGEASHIELDAFLAKDRGSPQRETLLRLIGSLVSGEDDSEERQRTASRGPVHE